MIKYIKERIHERKPLERLRSPYGVMLKSFHDVYGIDEDQFIKMINHFVGERINTLRKNSYIDLISDVIKFFIIILMFVLVGFTIKYNPT